ncbi:MAG TPA: acetyl-CoA carboxylase, biotin carboxyl carrier protein, partial [Moraxellaceae bacterium]|nr:acetyl-CoA carboxylase, biotin carboxyl carrier protein [Moraxellaceae bacterium]
MDISKIKQLIDLMEERTLAELTVQDGDKKVSI